MIAKRLKSARTREVIATTSSRLVARFKTFGSITTNARAGPGLTFLPKEIVACTVQMDLRYYRSWDSLYSKGF